MTCRLESVTDLSRDTARYRFATPRPLRSTQMAHVLAVDAGNILRPYTPVAESATQLTASSPAPNAGSGAVASPAQRAMA